MHPSRFFGFLLLIYLSATALASLYLTKIPLLPYLLIAILILVLALWRLMKVRYFLLLIFVPLLAIYRFQAFNKPPDFKFGTLYDTRGVIKDEPKIIGNRQVIPLEVSEGDVIQISTNQTPSYHLGEGLHVVGPLADPIIGNEEYRGLYLSQGIKGTMNYPEIQTISVKPFLLILIRQKLVSVRKIYEDTISRLLPEPQAGFLSGIILGSKTNISTETASALSRTGTTHLIALSGFNITILASFALILCRGLSRRWAFWLPLTFIAAFVLATGLSASVIRAAIMGTLLLLAKYYGRQPNAPIAILFASVIMVYVNPMILVYDIGFQLSFGAILGIVLFGPILEPVFGALGPKLGEILAATFAAQIFTWPITVFYFKTFSLIAPLANLIILPIIPWIMLIGFVLATLTLVMPFLISLFRIPLFLILDFPLRLIQMLSQLKFAALNIELVSPLVVLGYYFFVFDLFLLLNRRNGKQRKFA
jgi:competence protein ComEC